MSQTLQELETGLESPSLADADRARLLRIRDLVTAQGCAEDGRLADAEALLRDALAAQVDAAPDDAETAWYLATLAVVLVRLDGYEEAYELASAARAIADRLVPIDDPIHVTIRDCAGRTALVLERFEEAARDLCIVVDLVDETDPFREGTLAEAAARALLPLGRTRAALAMAARASNAYGRASEEGEVGCVRARLLCGQLLFQMGDAQRAIDALSGALRDIDRVFGPAAPESLRALEALAIALAGAGRHTHAALVGDRLVRARRARCGDTSVEAADALLTAGLLDAWWYESEPDPDRLRAAITALDRAEASFTRAGWPAPPELALVRGVLETDAGDFARAADTLFNLLDEGVCPPVIDAVRALASRAAAAGDRGLACEITRTLRRRLSRVLGDRHAVTIFVSAGLATLLVEEGRTEEAEREYSNAVRLLDETGLLEEVGFDIALNYALLLWERGRPDAAEQLVGRVTAGLTAESSEAGSMRSECFERMRRALESKGDTVGAHSVAAAWRIYLERTAAPDDPRHSWASSLAAASGSPRPE